MFGLSKQLKHFVLAVVGVAALDTACAAQKPTSKPLPPPRRPVAAKVTGAHLVGVNIPKTAACPVKLHFAGTITTNGPAEVKYTWVSFDGGSWPVGTLSFKAAGTQKVSQELQMGAPGQTLHGWLQLKVTAPNAVVSTRAVYVVKCNPLRVPKKK